MDKDRLNHSFAVANKMVELGKDSKQYINCVKIIKELRS